MTYEDGRVARWPQMAWSLCRHCRERSSSVDILLRVCRARFVTGQKVEGGCVLDRGNPAAEPTVIPASWTDTAPLRHAESRNGGDTRNLEKKGPTSRGDKKSKEWTLYMDKPPPGFQGQREGKGARDGLIVATGQSWKKYIHRHSIAYSMGPSLSQRSDRAGDCQIDSGILSCITASIWRASSPSALFERAATERGPAIDKSVHRSACDRMSQPFKHGVKTVRSPRSQTPSHLRPGTRLRIKLQELLLPLPFSPTIHYRKQYVLRPRCPSYNYSLSYLGPSNRHKPKPPS